MIAYHILCHGNFTQVELLIASLYSEDDVFLIDVDDGQKPDLSPIDDWLKRDNVHCRIDSNIGWGGGGTLRKTLRGALELLELSSSWQYYIVLSGQDLPLKSNAHIKQELAKGVDAGSSYLRWSRVDVPNPTSLPIVHEESKIRLWADRGHTRIFVKPDAPNPQAEFGARWQVDVCEVGENSEVYIGKCDELLLRFRRHFFSKTPYYVGANWFNLHRQLIEHMAADPFAMELYEVLRTTFIPDEAYFQTYLLNSTLANTAVLDNSRLILRPGPKPRVKVLEMADLAAISNGPELFGRKFDIEHDAEVVNHVLQSRG